MAVAATPTNFYVQQGNTNVALLWDIMSGATSYQIQRSTDGVTFSNLTAPVVNYYLDTSVASGTRYYYQVASVNGSGTSSYTTAQMVIPASTAQLALFHLRLLAQQRADRVNSNFVTLPEWNSYINQAYFELYDLLVTTYEDYFVATPAIYATDGSSAQYALPDGSATFLNAAGSTFVAKAFYKLMGVDCGTALNNNAWITLRKFDFVARNRFLYPNNGGSGLGVFNLQYRLLGSTVEFIPTPAASQYIRLWYIPRVTQLLQETDILDGVSGWTEYVVVDAAIRALKKEESDTQELQLEKNMLIKRIENSAMNRDAGQPDTISDVRAGSGLWCGPGFDGSFGGY